MYDEITKNQSGSQIEGIIREGFELGAMERAFRESPEIDEFSEGLTKAIGNISSRIKRISEQAT